MKLVKTFGTSDCSSKDTIVLVRHGVDDPTLSKDLNQPLVEETKPDIKLLANKLIRFVGSIDVNEVNMYHSNRLRAIQTASIIAEQLFSADINTHLQESVGIREIYQGDFIIAEDHVHGNDYQPLVDAWVVWQQKLDDCELEYRFGDPLCNPSGSPTYPELVGWFNSFGENQAEFSLRLYRLLFDIFKNESPLLDVVIGHQASCSRIQRILNSVSKLTTPSEFEAGEFVRFLEKKGNRLTVEPASGVVIRKPEREITLDVLQKEIGFLETIV